MKKGDLVSRGVVVAMLLMIGAGGCGAPLSEPTPTLTPEPTPLLPPADEVAFAFLQAWQREDYAAMYSLLTKEAQQETDEDLFTLTYRQIGREATLLSATPRILASYQPDTEAEVVFAVTFQTALVGSFEIENRMPLSFEDGVWAVSWSPALVLPQLGRDTFLRMTKWAPSRGNIYDRNGKGLAMQGKVVEVGVVPGRIEDESALLGRLSPLLGESPANLQARYTDALPEWYVPLGRITTESAQTHYDMLTSLGGIEMREAWTRAYRPEIVAPHVVGVVGPIPMEEVDLWRSQGYDGDEFVGQMGLERWGERYLAGARGGRLEILTAKGERVAVLAEKPSRESSSIYATFDRECQDAVQEILGERLGAIAVIEAKTGRVLALATFPLFDPNPFSTGIAAGDWASLQADARRPMVNRATQGTYPPGSVFKVVTTAAGMGSGGLTAESSFICKGTWTGLGPEWPKVCWLRSGHGRIALNRALTVSCDITFYQVGLLLNGADQELLPRYARDFGLGSLSGIEIQESAGLVPDPSWKIRTKGEGWAPGDSVNLAIGQSEMLATPLQVARMMAAVGNGGTLYRPQVVEMIAADPDKPEWVFAPVVAGQLPVDGEALAVIQQSLHQVTSASYGTAYKAFEGLTVPVAGKTGTAESGQRLPHAWFAGYAPAEDPEIAIAVVIEHVGEGAAFAAPLFRKVVELYFDIQPEIEVTPTAEP